MCVRERERERERERNTSCCAAPVLRAPASGLRPSWLSPQWLSGCQLVTACSGLRPFLACAACLAACVPWSVDGVTVAPWPWICKEAGTHGSWTLGFALFPSLVVDPAKDREACAFGLGR